MGSDSAWGSAGDNTEVFLWAVRVHVLGDSHTDVIRDYMGDIYEVTRCIITAYNLWGHGILQWYTRGLRNYDKMLLSFGEVDCRMHIYPKSRADGLSFSEGVDRTIWNYGVALEWLKGRVDFAVFNIVPPGVWDMLKVNAYYEGRRSAPFRWLKEIHALFRRKLNEYCNENGIKVIDMWDELVDVETGGTKEYLRVDAVHLGENAVPIVKRHVEKALNI